MPKKYQKSEQDLRAARDLYYACAVQIMNVIKPYCKINKP